MTHSALHHTHSWHHKSRTLLLRKHCLTFFADEMQDRLPLQDWERRRRNLGIPVQRADFARPSSRTMSGSALPQWQPLTANAARMTSATGDHLPARQLRRWSLPHPTQPWPWLLDAANNHVSAIKIQSSSNPARVQNETKWQKSCTYWRIGSIVRRSRCPSLHKTGNSGSRPATIL